MSPSISMGYSGHGSRLQIKGGERVHVLVSAEQNDTISTQAFPYVGPRCCWCAAAAAGARSFCDLWSLLLRENKNCSHPCWAVCCSMC